ncbi:MAG TPA: hypothetical protein VKF40_01670 [Burkholderiales bacterium]|nr:hypothetical protein [Burkholderiales bacterium]
MYGLPPEFDPTILVGRFLSSVSFGAGSVSLNFDQPKGPGESNRISISVVGSYTSTTVDGVKVEGTAANPLSGTFLLRLLNLDVTSAEKMGRGDLLLRFGDAQDIRLIEDETGFECYTICVPGEQPFVV